MLKHLSKEFPTLSQAEEHYEVDYFSEDPLIDIASEPTLVHQLLLPSLLIVFVEMWISILCLRYSLVHMEKALGKDPT